MSELKLYPWQKNQWQQLAALLTTQGRGLLLQAASGSGLARVADVFCASKLCLSDSASACGDCRSCHLFISDSHPDLLRISIPEKSQSIGVDAIRQLSQFTQTTNQLSSCKLVLIEQAQAMTVAAQNALLKTLEEPVANVLLILLTETKQALLPTIISRCLPIALSAADASAKSWLATECPEQDLDTLWSLAQGRPLLALELAQASNWQARQDFYQDLLKISHGQCPIQVAARWEKLKSNYLTTWLQLWVYDLALLASANTKILNQDFQSGLQQLSSALNAQAIFSFNEKLLSLITQGSKVALNQLLLFEKIAVEWSRLTKRAHG